MLRAGILWKGPRKRKTPRRDLTSVRGLLEGVVGDRLTGWVLDGRALGRPMTVTLVTDRGDRREIYADSYRADLQRAGLGDGHVAFSVPVARFDGAKSIRAFVGEHELPGSPAALNAAAKDGVHHAIGALHLWLDHPPPAGTSVSGWIYDPTDPTQRCRIALRSGGRIHGATKATLFRPDLADASAADSLHGFRLMLDTVNVKPKDRIELVDGDTGMVLARLRN
jgi:hypothetical protein